MSALVGYYTAMTNDRNAAAQLAQSQARATDVTAGETAANADSQRQLQAAQARGLNATAATTQPLAASEIALRGQQGALIGAQAGYTAAQTRSEPALSASEIALRTAQAGLTGAQAQNAGALGQSEIGLNLARIAGTQAGTMQTRLGLQPLDGLSPGIGTAIDKRLLPSGSVPGYAKGTSSAGSPSKPGKTDTIAAKLSPGEAVLNRGATEHLGKGVIDHLNKLGMMRMAAQDEVAKHAAAVDAHTIPAMAKAIKSKKKKAA